MPLSMTRTGLYFFLLVLITSACTQRMTCPAFQSAFIYDQEELRKKFSYFKEDSTPKILTASKNKFLIAEPVSYRKKLRSMATLEMKDVPVVLPDSMRKDKEGEMGEDGVVPGAELDLAARSVIDSTYIVDIPRDTTTATEDSVYMISKDKEIRALRYNMPDSLVYDPSSGRYGTETPMYQVDQVTFNVDQDNYMWYLRRYLVLPDVRLAQRQQRSEDQQEKSGKKKKKGSFFKNLFKKKKETTDTTALAPQKPAEEFDYVDEDEQLKAPTAPVEEPAKKGLFKKKKKEEQPPSDQSAVSNGNRPGWR